VEKKKGERGRKDEGERMKDETGELKAEIGGRGLSR